MDNELSRVCKLQDAKNWNVWKFQVETLMSTNDNITVVTGECEKPATLPENASTAEFAAHQKLVGEWKKRDGAVRRIIVTTVCEATLIHIMNCKTAKEMWDKLHEVYENKSEVTKHMLQQEWFTVGKDQADNMVTHIAKIKDLAHKLNALGDNIADGMIMTKILMTLPPGYKYFVTAWESASEDQRTLINLTSRLITEETRLNLQEGNSALGARATSKSKKHYASKGGKKPGKCFSCNERGHWKIDCPKEKEKGARKEKNENERERGPKVLIVTVDSTAATGCHIQGDEWYLDSGASQHMSARKEWFTNYKDLQNEIPIKIGDGKIILARGKGDIHIEAFDGNRWDTCILTNVLYVPMIKFNLYSVPAAVDKNLRVISEQNECSILSEDSVVAVGVRSGNLYQMRFKVTMSRVSSDQNVCVHELKKGSLQLWHERLVHQNVTQVRKILKTMGIDAEVEGNFFCEGCALGKMHRQSFPISKSKTNEPGELVHADLCGPMETKSFGGANYFLLFKDDYSHYKTLYFLKSKTDVPQYFDEFLKKVQNQLGRTIKRLRTDNGLEFTNEEIKKITAKYGIEHERTVIYTPEQNGSAERENRTLVEAARTMMCSKDLDKSFWAEAVNTAAYVLNRTGTSSITEKTPYELWHSKAASETKFKILGTKVFCHIPKEKRKKWDPKSRPGILVGYGETTKGYRIWFPSEKKVEILRDVIFADEKTGVSKGEIVPVEDNSVPVQITCEDKVSEEKRNDEPFIPHDVQEELVIPQQGVPRYDLRNRDRIQVPERFTDYVDADEVFLAKCQEPKTFDEAVQSEQAAQWKNAMNGEMDSLIKNKTWDLVEFPKGAQILQNRWVYKIKESSNGLPSIYKARLVVKGFTQQPGVDYLETFSPVVKLTSVRAILMVAITTRMKLFQFDVKTAYLNGDLKEDIYMEQPKGYEDGSYKICKLNKALYGLKQAGRCWNEKFTKCLNKFNLKATDADPCVFINEGEEEKLILAIYVDDGLVASTDDEKIKDLLAHLSENFEIKVNALDMFVGMELKHFKDGSVLLHQEQYARRVLERFKMDKAYAVATPADQHQDLSIQTQDKESKSVNVPYKEAVGCLLYLAMVSRPDIAYAVNVVSQFAESPTKEHWNAVKRILKYIKGTTNYGILIKSRQSFTLKVYSDADFAGDKAKRKSTSGLVVFLGETPISWSARKQRSVALSTTESEYIAASEAARELIWVKRLVKDLIKVDLQRPTMFIDNQSAIRLIKNPELHQRTKHIDVRFHFIRELYEDEVFNLEYVSTEEQIADICTKPLAKCRFETLRQKLGMTGGDMY